ncbi:4-hydroxyphenylpyruvate dioxygenase [Halothece sp. PCC 7418]|uniref:4-hydroxyphenylpyruvate dioxygenase n=1 Tax=Halothece sp. (strain PCC 7418) TaxID=65093 RepID=UPI0002A07837|nr:4-hydroxyphenylpyruvate dioxygenase [Halothece sp. PCC 7418]AFZ44850.1 4-hydroxyphenylpyruvate dioxygenase [Halothece sp. PCC 7418]
MQIDQIHFYLDNASQWRDWFIAQMGFEAIASGNSDPNTLVEVVKSGAAEFLLYSPQNDKSPVADYLKHHPPGVAAITFAVSQLEDYLSQGLRSHVTFLQPLQTIQTDLGCLKWCQISGMTGLIHTLVERTGKTPLLPSRPHWLQKSPVTSARGCYFTGIDHLVLNVPQGELKPTVEWYERIFGWQRKQAFSIATARSGLHSQVLVSPNGAVQFPINEPSSDHSQIQEFLDFNRGAGIQHIALSTPNITAVTLKLKQQGVSFLRVPETYYRELQERFRELPFSESEWAHLQKAQVLVDCEAQEEDSSNLDSSRRPLLLQIFTQPIFAEPTFFFELIERRDRAQGFGEGNFRALFAAIEREQQERR